jgi:hypothetical protein
MLAAFEMCHELSPSEHAAGGAFTGTDSWEQVQRRKDKRLQGSALRGVLDDFQETLSMSGRHLFVALAVDRSEAQHLEPKEKLDKRNLHLAKEGVILEDSPQAKDMPAADLAKRARDWQEKKAKLANPNFSVNRTRLSVPIIYSVWRGRVITIFLYIYFIFFEHL